MITLRIMCWGDPGLPGWTLSTAAVPLLGGGQMGPEHRREDSVRTGSRLSDGATGPGSPESTRS